MIVFIIHALKTKQDCFYTKMKIKPCMLWVCLKIQPDHGVSYTTQIMVSEFCECGYVELVFSKYFHEQTQLIDLPWVVYLQVIP